MLQCHSECLKQVFLGISSRNSRQKAKANKILKEINWNGLIQYVNQDFLSPVEETSFWKASVEPEMRWTPPHHWGSLSHPASQQGEGEELKNGGKVVKAWFLGKESEKIRLISWGCVCLKWAPDKIFFKVDRPLSVPFLICTSGFSQTRQAGSAT